MKNTTDKNKNIEKINNILKKHMGKKNPISSSLIADKLDIQENATYAKTRGLILECAEKYNLALAAGNRGYYLIEKQEEYDEYIENLNSRIKGIEDRKTLIEKNFKKKQ